MPSLSLDLFEYLYSDVDQYQETVYDLSAIICHHGASMNHGHYTGKLHLSSKDSKLISPIFPKLFVKILVITNGDILMTQLYQVLEMSLLYFFPKSL